MQSFYLLPVAKLSFDFLCKALLMKLLFNLHQAINTKAIAVLPQDKRIFSPGKFHSVTLAMANITHFAFECIAAPGALFVFMFGHGYASLNPSKGEALVQNYLEIIISITVLKPQAFLPSKGGF